jgi:uncharacterized membrane protein YfcA
VLASNTTQVATIPVDNEDSRQRYTGFAVAKAPIYALHGLIIRSSLFFNVLMIPAVLLGAILGRRIVDRIPERIFEVVMVLLTAGSTLMLLR